MRTNLAARATFSLITFGGIESDTKAVACGCFVLLREVATISVIVLIENLDEKKILVKLFKF